jgi:class 3 adenylate cyclase
MTAAMTAVVYEHRGVVDKFVGDLVMALFGAPKSYGKDALGAVRCARHDRGAPPAQRSVAPSTSRSALCSLRAWWWPAARGRAIA